jgi:hypothetical protein
MRIGRCEILAKVERMKANGRKIPETEKLFAVKGSFETKKNPWNLSSSAVLSSPSSYLSDLSSRRYLTKKGHPFARVAFHFFRVGLIRKLI